MARTSIHAIPVSDNHKKFAIAVTRARVDSRVFFCLFLQLSAPRITWMRASALNFPANPLPLYGITIESYTCGSENLSNHHKVYALRTKNPCRI
jgi:hypothetical protein